MEIRYNIQGSARKEMARAIAEIAGGEVVYKGAPTFAYEAAGFVIDREGTLSFDDANDKESIRILLAGLRERGYQHEEDEESTAFADLRLTEAEELGRGQQHHDPWGEDGMQASDVQDPIGEDGSCRLVIEVPLTGFTPEKLDNLAKLVNAKAPLLKAALGTDDLSIQQTADTLKFPWFGDGLDADTVKAYASLVGMICAAAKAKHRVTAQEKDPENKKYAMRCWLLSLGFIGDEYRVSRKILLSKLDGDSSWKHKRTYTAHCYIYPNGSEEDAMDATVEEFTSLAKAKAHVDTFAANTDGIYFAGAHVEDEKGNYVYELLCG